MDKISPPTEDFVAAGFATRPYPEDSPIPYTPLSPEREMAWEREARAAIKLAARTFRGRKSGDAKDGPTLLWRTLHHPPRHNYAPFPVSGENTRAERGSTLTFLD